MTKSPAFQIVLGFLLCVRAWAGAVEQPATVYTNPVLPGFHADPSICRAGDDYYMVHSTFEYFPGVPVYHSRDLVNWKLIGHCLTRKSQLNLDRVRSSMGIFAPTIRYHAGTFYMITTTVGAGGNFYVTATNAAGPWSEPVWVDRPGIDPSLFFDDDGKVYYTRQVDGERGYSGQQLLDLQTGKLEGEMKELWRGTGGVWPEGPHLYKVAGKYYLMISEGGTSYDHCLTIARSDSPWGPFEANPKNPILTHRHLPKHLFQALGHGDLVETPDGWWAIFLGFRPQGGNFHHLGRETFLAPVTWENGWPVVNGGQPISTTLPAPKLEPHPWPQDPARDEFDSGKLRLNWQFVRNPVEQNYSLAERPGWLRLKGSAASLNDLASPTFVGRSQDDLFCRIATRLSFQPKQTNEEAGLVLRGNEGNHCEIVVTLRDGKRVVGLRRTLDGLFVESVQFRVVPVGEIILGIHAAPLNYEFFWSGTDGLEHPLGTVPTRALSTETLTAQKGAHFNFTGVFAGLFATGNGTANSVPADFDWFEYQPTSPRNLFAETGHSPAEVKARMESAFNQLFHGDPADEAVYFTSGTNTNGSLAYIYDIGSGDVRSEGMSYGMMIAVQLGKQAEFDALWNWSKTFMQRTATNHPARGYFAWSMKTNGVPNDEMPAPDGEEYYATALLFAAGRWGNGTGIYNYQAESDKLITDLRHRELITGPTSAGEKTAGAMFHPDKKMVRFTPDTEIGEHTDPSYHLPAFYEVWARYGPEKDRSFWKEAAAASRDYFPRAAHPVTGLTPDYSEFDGRPWGTPWNQRATNFVADAWRTAMNWSVDWAWWHADPREQELSSRLLAFFKSQGMTSYSYHFTLDGRPLATGQSAGLIAVNAIAALAVDPTQGRPFVEAFWNLPTPSGQYRYYDGMLHLLALLHCSGEFRIWPPTNQVSNAHPALNNNSATQADHKRMLDLLGIKSLRPGREGFNTNSPNYANYNEAKANPFPVLPDPLTLNNGTKVTTAEMWWKLRRPEIVEDFDREIYGRVPKQTPKVTWETVSTTRETNGEVPVITKQLVGHVDNSSCTNITVDIQLTLSTPADAANPVPVIMQFGFNFGGKFRPPPTVTPTWQQQCLAKGWGYAVITPTSYQADNGAGLAAGIIGLCNKGQPRKVDDWGALRAWAWGASRALDYFETDKAVDAKRVGIEGHSRYGKATLVAMAYDSRFAAAYVSSSGEGGAKLHRRDWGEIVENVASSGEYHWMAGNFIKYARPLNWNDLPVDSHELIALCAPRPVFLSTGTLEKGDGWVDPKGTFLAGVAAAPVYALLGKNPFTEKEFPPVETYCEGDLAFRQHSGGHTDGPNWPVFLSFAEKYFSNTLPAAK